MVNRELVQAREDSSSLSSSLQSELTQQRKCRALAHERAGMLGTLRAENEMLLHALHQLGVVAPSRLAALERPTLPDAVEAQLRHVSAQFPLQR